MNQDTQQILTPRCDEACRAELDGSFTQFVPVGFARTLERQLVQKEQEFKSLEEQYTKQGEKFIIRAEQFAQMQWDLGICSECSGSIYHHLDEPFYTCQGCGISGVATVIPKIQFLRSELSKKEEELKQEQATGQEVHDYLCSVNPDNIYLSVLESVIQQRGIENMLRESNKELQSERDKLRTALEALLRQTSNIEVLGEWEALEINTGMRRTVREKVNAVIDQCDEALNPTKSPHNDPS